MPRILRVLRAYVFVEGVLAPALIGVAFSFVVAWESVDGIARLGLRLDGIQAALFASLVGFPLVLLSGVGFLTLARSARRCF